MSAAVMLMADVQIRVTPESFMALLSAEEPELAARAYGWLCQLMERALGRRERQPDKVDELVQGFMQWLLDDPARIERIRVYEHDAALIQCMRRWLGQHEAHEDLETCWRRRLYKKVCRQLQTQPEFVALSGGRWRLAREHDHEPVAALPLLPALMRAPNERRMPQIAANADIKRQLIATLLLERRPLTSGELSDQCWKQLSARPTLRDGSDDELLTPRGVDHHDLEQRAASVLTRLSSDELAVARLRYVEMLSLREAALRLERTKSYVEHHQRGWEATLEASRCMEGLEEPEQRALAAMIIARLEQMSAEET